MTTTADTPNRLQLEATVEHIAVHVEAFLSSETDGQRRRHELEINRLVMDLLMTINAIAAGPTVQPPQRDSIPPGGAAEIFRAAGRQAQGASDRLARLGYRPKKPPWEPPKK